VVGLLEATATNSIVKVLAVRLMELFGESLLVNLKTPPELLG
jgi:hypothetical protein